MKSLGFCVFFILIFSGSCLAKSITTSESRFPVKGYVCETKATYVTPKKAKEQQLQFFVLTLSKDATQWSWECKRTGGAPDTGIYECSGEKTGNGASESLSTTYSSTGESGMRRCMKFVDSIK